MRGPGDYNSVWAQSVHWKQRYPGPKKQSVQKSRDLTTWLIGKLQIRKYRVHKDEGRQVGTGVLKKFGFYTHGELLKIKEKDLIRRK